MTRRHAGPAARPELRPARSHPIKYRRPLPQAVTLGGDMTEHTSQHAGHQGDAGKLIPALAWLSTSKGNLYLGLSCDCATALILLAAAVHERSDLRVAGALLTIALGLLVFSFMEYATHRWIFHGPRSPLQAGHERHHLNAAGYDALPFFLPPLVMAVLAALFATALAPGYALLLAGTVAAAYAAYGISHTILHLYEFQGHPLLHRWWDFHRLHHVYPDKNFGVTTGLWDVLLGTRYKPPRK